MPVRIENSTLEMIFIREIDVDASCLSGNFNSYA